MFDFMGKMNDIKSRMEETKNKLEQTEIHAISSNGMIRVTANGNRKITDIKIEDGFYETKSKDEMIASLMEAINDATNKSELLMKEQMKNATAGLLPNIPGLNMD